MSQLSAILKPERVLGMLLDVTESRVMEIHREALPSYKQWRRCIVRNQDQSFVSDLLGIATDILGRALRQQPLCTEATTPTSKPTLHENFTLFPRKVKIGQNKVLVIFTEPLVKEDWIKVKIEKAGQMIEITNVKRRNPYTVQFVVPGEILGLVLSFKDV
jgi:phosphoinositide 3-kinase adapter protein 1